jgi:ABC-type multidrug transport system fused ATPase/permease subunit
MDALANLDSKITIMLIAHRLSTVRQCDIIYLLENGSVRCSGSYDELFDTDEVFKKMINSAT